MVSSPLYLEDVAIGSKFGSPTYKVGADDIVGFAAEFDPQVFHLDEEGAKETFFGQLVASGWHTASITMRLLVLSDFNPAGGIVGAGVEEIRWVRPLVPGDALTLEITALESIPSQTNPDRGMIRLRVVTLNQRKQTVQVMVPKLVMQRRLEGEALSGNDKTRAAIADPAL
ncbi:MaoC family dehydratase [Breoghania sp.]|uniref:MaoC family dehydratase n=1 Tax=Breoghania sp. TaxID=2065378 RepID=UPI002AAB1481|nr:MaoC family dehydratase [Breoghania sp.]